ncbi:hypothetical protein cce_5269 (plasmid) [Crocosphaera subtropica ATCC 51142]|uniref:HNH domain-containing protein n=1 Tax=Crocosphaera subtropica (strain ATCC 51142 / BH68) TaxID=43989 RepID=B1X3A4_CROS5|nr:HNH endonuclease [Crocosphaera subtropica]ACB54615.1 hypothetical protein cce_5269 [Crocosphaera subtropica ATCC 51142]
MKNRDRYPDDWDEIALRVKQSANWTCSKCGQICLSPDDKLSINLCPTILYKAIHPLSLLLFWLIIIQQWLTDKSVRTKYTLTVHHSDYDPSNNHESNLIPLCSACHLYLHRGQRGNISPGQLKLELEV